MRIARAHETILAAGGTGTYEHLLERRIRAGRRRIDMLCHQDDPISARAAFALHRTCVELDALLDQHPQYSLDRDLRVVTAEEPRFHRFPQLPLDYEMEPCRTCQRLLAEVIPGLVDLGDYAPVSPAELGDLRVLGERGAA